MQDALARQVGGEHYVKTAIQPFEFSMANGYDACAHTILKYVSRHRRKAGLEDLRKALHVVDIRAVLAQPDWRKRAFSIFNGRLVALLGYEPKPDEDPRISVDRYCFENGIVEPDAAALKLLDEWVRSRNSNLGQIALLRGAINNIAVNVYGEDIL